VFYRIQDIFGNVRVSVEKLAFVSSYSLEKLPLAVEIIKDLTQQLVSVLSIGFHNNYLPQATQM